VHQIPSTKHQIPNKFEFQKNKFKTFWISNLGFGIYLVFGAWRLEFIWYLVLGAWNFIFLSFALT
jgi:hypothetical protein